MAVNTDIEMPLKLEEGQPCSLGLFVEAAIEDQLPSNLPKGKRILEAWSKHGRSAVLGRVIFKDRQDRLYRDIDLKGIGFINTYPGGKALNVWQPGMVADDGKTRLGLLDSDIALADYQLTEEFLNAGIRSCRVIAVIGLEEIIIRGEKLSLKKAIRKGIIDEDFYPAIEVRAFATRARIADILDTDYEHKKVLVDDARRIVGQELSSKPLSDMDYLKWFGKVLGRSVGLMHKNGWYHQYLSSHNITLDGRIVDLDSLEQLVDYWESNEDYAMAKEALKQLYRAVRGGLGVPHDYDLAFAYAYNEAFPVEVRKQYYAQQGKMLEEH